MTPRSSVPPKHPQRERLDVTDPRPCRTCTMWHPRWPARWQRFLHRIGVYP